MTNTLPSKQFFLLEGDGRRPQAVATADAAGAWHGETGSTPAGKLYCAYSGASMRPTLSGNDLLEVASYGDAEQPRPGDVILFTPRPAYPFVIHRIITVTPTGFLTQGDFCDTADPWLLTGEEIIGRVVAATSHTGRRPIRGGIPGRLHAAYARLRRRLGFWLAKIPLFILKILMAEAGKLNLNPAAEHGPKIYRFETPQQAVYKLIVGNKIIGSYDHAARRWHIRLPYRLFLNKSSLPLPQHAVHA